MSCDIAKSKKLPFNTSREYRPAVGECAYVDYWGPLSQTKRSADGCTGRVGFIDAGSNFHVSYLVSSQDGFVDLLRDYCSIIKSYGKSVRELRGDDFSIYRSKDLIAYCQQEGIRLPETIGYNPELIGKVERSHRTVVELAYAMMLHAQAPFKYWTYAFDAATYLINRLPCSANPGDKSPYQVLTRRKPALQYLRIWFSDSVVNIPKEKRSKGEFRGMKLKLIGFLDNGYRFIDPLTDKLYKSRSAKFYEAIAETDLPYGEALYDMFFGEHEGSMATDSEFQSAFSYDSYSSISQLSLSEVSHLSDQDADADQTEESEFESLNSSDVDAENGLDDQQLNLRCDVDRRNILSGSRLRARANHAALNLVSSQEVFTPHSYKQAINCPDASKWQVSMEKEMNGHVQNETWTLVKKEKGMQILSVKWVYRVKYNEDNSVAEFKSRLVVRGFEQTEGFSFESAFAPSAGYTLLRLLLGLSAQYSASIDHWDFITAFLQAKLKSVVYIAQPEGFVVRGKEDYVGKLNKGMYGLIEAPKLWNEELASGIKGGGLTRSAVDPCLYFARSDDGKGFIILTPTVDDCFVLNCNADYLKAQLADYLTENYKIDMRGKLKWALGMEIISNDDNSLHQLSHHLYIVKMIEKHHIDVSIKVLAPMTVEDDWPKVRLNDTELKIDFRSLVGEMMHLMVTSRPDISYAVGQLVRKFQEPNVNALKAAVSLARYLHWSRFEVLTFQKNSDVDVLSVHVDADFGTSADRKSTTGYIASLYGNTIDYFSKKQSNVTLSSSEAEFVAMSSAIQQSYYLKMLMEEIGLECGPVKLNCDNKSAITLMNNNSSNSRSRHIDIKYQYAREKVMDGEVKVDYVATNQNKADCLTKLSAKNKISNFRSAIGMSKLIKQDIEDVDVFDQ
ncbi:hypothetical protein MIR68_000314 [Amoeboaphelidium protococcarum]|nr:hypothetical protein MIR68_000314 [Amoeboaphelidium protococcarum]